MKNSKNKLKKHKIYKISTTGLGVITTSSILAIAISCGGGGTKEPLESTEDQKIVDAITLEEVQKEIQNLFTNHLDKTATNAKAAVAATTVTIQGATVTFTLEQADDAAKNIVYTINKIIKGDAQRNIDELGDLGSTITGFKTQAWIDNQNIINGIKKQEINDEIKKLFAAHLANKTATEAKASVADTTVEIRDVIITFTLETPDDTKGEIGYKITKIEKNGVERAQEDLSGLGGKIDGFMTENQAQARDQTIVDGIQQQDIKIKIQDLFTNYFNTTTTQAKNAVTTTTVTVKGATVTFVLGPTDDTSTEISYTINKITKGNVERAQNDLDSLKGKISGFKTANWIQKRKELSDNILQYLKLDSSNNGKITLDEKTSIEAGLSNFFNIEFLYIDELAAGTKTIQQIRDDILNTPLKKSELNNQIIKSLFLKYQAVDKANDTVEIQGFIYKKSHFDKFIDDLNNNRFDNALILDSYSAYQGSFSDINKENEFFNVTTNISARQFNREGSLTGLKLPNVEIIGESAFEDSKFTGSLSLPNVTIIGTSAFKNSSFTGSLSLPNVKYIGESLFKNSSFTGSLSLPNAIGIGGFAFENSRFTGPLTLDNATIIGESAFNKSKFTGALSLPNVKTISNSAFYESKFTGALSLPNVKTIGTSAFYKSGFWGSLSLPKATAIGTSAFRKSTFLETLSLPNVTTIGGFAFEDSKFIGSLTLDNVTDIGASAFKNSLFTGSLSLPNVKTIGISTFNNSQFSGSLSLPNATAIGDKAFVESLFKGNISSLDNVETIGTSAFYKSNFIGKLSLPNVKTIGASAFDSSLFTGPLNLDNATIINESAFNNSQFSGSLSLPNATAIGTQAFLNSQFTGTLSLPNATAIGNQAFLNSQFTGNIFLPKATTIGQKVFESVANIASNKVTWLASLNTDVNKNRIFASWSNIVFIEV